MTLWSLVVHRESACLNWALPNEVQYLPAAYSRRLLQELSEPLRTPAELDAFTGLRRGELIGLQWEDVDFENLVIHVRRSVVMMVQGVPKTEASAKDVPLDAALAESLLKLRLVGPYNRETDWVFALPTMKGKQPLCQRPSGEDTGDQQ